jgi:hypothetical protein
MSNEQPKGQQEQGKGGQHEQGKGGQHEQGKGTKQGAQERSKK